MRRELGDWRPLPVPRLLWFNTAVLVLEQPRARMGADAPRAAANIDQVRLGLLAGGVFAVAFLGGQLLAWRQLGSRPASTSPQSGQQLLLPRHRAAWPPYPRWPRGAGLRTAVKAGQRGRCRAVRLNVELCAIYWLFMLFVWMVLFSLLAGWGSDDLGVLLPSANQIRADAPHEPTGHVRPGAHLTRPAAARLRLRLVVRQAAFKNVSWGKAMMWIFLFRTPSSSAASCSPT